MPEVSQKTNVTTIAADRQPQETSQQHKALPIESRYLSYEGTKVINNLLQGAQTVLKSIVGSEHKKNKYFSPLKPPAVTVAELLAKEAVKQIEELKQKNLEEVEVAKNALNALDIEPEDLKREMREALSRTDAMGNPLSMAGRAVLLYAKQGKDKVVEEYEAAKAEDAKAVKK